MRTRLFGPGLLLVLLSASVDAQTVPPADEIHWTVTGQNAVAFDWRGSASDLRYGPSVAYGLSATGLAPTPTPISSSGPFWEARISGLSAGSLYHYSIGGGPDHTFRTAPAPGSVGFTVVAIGDIGDSHTYPNMAQVQSLVAAQNPDFVLMVGDLTYGNAHGQAAVDQHFNDVMVWSQDAAYMPAWGNHEWDSSGDDLRNYKGRFDLPNPQTSPGSPAVSCCGEDWYWFDYGATRFIAYPEPWSGAWQDWKTRAAALMDQAQGDSTIATIVTFGHRPAHNSGHHADATELRAILDTLGARHSKYALNLNGHSHDYERATPQSGVVHITAGIGGSSLEQDGSCLWAGGCPPPPSTAFRAMHQGILRLHFTVTGIEGAALCGPPGGGVNDVTCSPGETMDQFFIPAVRPSPGGTVAAPPAPLVAWVSPQPLRGEGLLDFVTLDAGPASAELFDSGGRRVRVLMSSTAVSAGQHQVAVDGLDQRGNRLPAGAYFYRLRVGSHSISGRVLILPR